jgi:hypothetical protein
VTVLPDDRLVVFGGRTKERGIPNRSVEIVDVRKNTVTLRKKAEVPVVATGALDYPAGVCLALVVCSGSWCLGVMLGGWGGIPEGAHGWLKCGEEGCLSSCLLLVTRLPVAYPECIRCCAIASLITRFSSCFYRRGPEILPAQRCDLVTCEQATNALDFCPS